MKLNIDRQPGEKDDFQPNIINSTVFIICLALQVSTFAVNYKVSVNRQPVRLETIYLFAQFVGHSPLSMFDYVQKRYLNFSDLIPITHLSTN